jgi:putative Mn2+ efflux pump MntP
MGLFVWRAQRRHLQKKTRGVIVMGLLELFLLAVGLSMDAFAVALCKGLCMQKLDSREGLKIAAFFGGFQALMPLIGWALGKQFEQYITSFDHWVAFALLSLIGISMIREAFKNEEGEACACTKTSLRELTMLAIATSIDALAMGITFAFLRVDILPAVSFIGVTTFLLSFAGVCAGNRFGLKYQKKAQLAGGGVLLLMGLKIILEHLNVL